MGRLEIAGLALGAVLVTTGAALIFTPAGPITAGVLLIAASWPKDGSR